MKMFMLKAFFLMALMFLSVLFGMQQANQGIHNMKGYSDANFKDALTFNEDQKGDMQVSVLGNDIDSHDLQKKKEKLEEMKAFNFFSSMGKKLADGFSNLSETIINFVSGLIKND